MRVSVKRVWKTKKVTKTVRVGSAPVIGRVTVQMSLEEAEAVHSVLRSVGGSGTASRRKHTAAMETALRTAGVHYYSGDMNGTIYFKDIPVGTN